MQEILISKEKDRRLLFKSLKPLTRYYLYYNKVQTTNVKPAGGKVGDPIISDKEGKAEVFYYFSKDIGISTQSSASDYFRTTRKQYRKSNFVLSTTNVPELDDNWKEGDDGNSADTERPKPGISSSRGGATSRFNEGQSFYIDPDSVKKASVVFITSIELYFKYKPDPIKNLSGINNPGVIVRLCNMNNGKPNFGEVTENNMISRVEYSNIVANSSNSNTSTKFSFPQPVPLNTDNDYCILISYDGSDPNFVLWKNTAGEEDPVTGITTKLSAGRVDGNYFKFSNGNAIDPLPNVDLKFKINIAKFTNLNRTYKVCNKPYEFIRTIPTVTVGEFVGGEYVYIAKANLAGSVTTTSTTVNVTGTSTAFNVDLSNNNLVVISNGSVSEVKKINVVGNSTSFNVTTSFTQSFATANIFTFSNGTISVNKESNTVIGTNTSFLTQSSLSAGQFIVISDGTDGNTEVRKIISVSNNTQLVLDYKPSFTNSTAGWFFSPVAKVESFKADRYTLVLEDSSANSSLYFQSNKIIKGVDSLAKSTIDSLFNLKLAKYQPRYAILKPSGTEVEIFTNFSNTAYSQTSGNKKRVFEENPIFTSNDFIIASRSLEVTNPANLFANAKSLSTELVFKSTNEFTSPYVAEQNLDFTTYEFLINNDSTNETYANGAAYSRYISKPVDLQEGQIAEDLIVYLNAYRPNGTDIEVYARFINEEDNELLGQKNWTKLSLDVPVNSKIYSLDSNLNDYVSLKYYVPKYHSGALVTAGTFQTSSACNVITGSYSTVNTNIVSGDLVRIYNPTFPQTYFVESVVSSNTTTFTVSKSISNNDLIGAGLKVEKITDKKSAFLNNQNFNVLRYYNNNMARFDGFRQFAIKIVLLSPKYYLVPRVTDYRAIAVSA